MTQEMSAEERAQREFFLNMLRTEAFKCIFEPDFDEKSRDKCLRATGRLCNSLFLPYAGLSTDCDIDTFITSFNNAFKGERKLERIGDVVHYEYIQGAGSHTSRGQCGCPMMQFKQLEPTPLWCKCGTNFEKAMFEAVVKHPVQVELLESPLATGSESCRWLIHLKPPAITTGGAGIDTG
ncbi:MAG: hypothetical protein IBX68_05880 [Dehalococcoidia bacterium]|nr:hypothetical protein [Dehalococcoidia bacterium]